MKDIARKVRESVRIENVRSGKRSLGVSSLASLTHRLKAQYAARDLPLVFVFRTAHCVLIPQPPTRAFFQIAR